MGLEAFPPSFGILGLGGVAAFIAGALMLIDTTRLAVRTRRRPVRSGAAGLVGTLCDVEQSGGLRGHEAWVRVDGELWRAVSGGALRPGQTVRVVRRSGVTLEVVPADGKENV